MHAALPPQPFEIGIFFKSSNVRMHCKSVRGGAAHSAFVTPTSEAFAAPAVVSVVAVVLLVVAAVPAEAFLVGPIIFSVRGGAAPSVIGTATLETFAFADVSRQILSPSMLPYQSRNSFSE